MNRLLPRTFFGQLVLGTVLVQTLFLVFFVWYVIVSQRKSSEARSRQRIVQQLDRLARACSDQIAEGNNNALHDILELSRISPSIEVARITNLQGQTLAVSDNGRYEALDASELAALPSAARQQVFKIGNGQLEAVTPIRRDGVPVALLWLEPNHAVSLTTANTVVRICLTYGAFALLFNLLPLFIIARRMTRPLLALREATRRLIRNPDLNTGFPLPVTNSNEAGELTLSFNIMVQELEEQRRGLLETLALLDSMLGNAPIGFAFFDRDLRYVRVNQSLAASHGLAVDAHLGRRATKFYPAALAEKKESSIAKVFATGEPIHDLQLSGETSNGPAGDRSWLMHFYPIRTNQEHIKWVGVIVVEITERLQAEEALRKNEKLAAAGRLAASIAHEINNPLESVTNLLYLLASHQPMDPGAVEFIATAQAELARVSEITQQTLRFYRQPTSPALTNITEVLDSILSLYQPRLMASRVTVTRKFRGEASVFGFSGELRQLFANLVGNAVDAMPHGGRLILSARTASGRQMDGLWTKGVRITVTDTGTGMSETTLRRLFEAFYTTKEATGTGLGLWVSEEIVRKHLGSIRVRTRQSAKSGTTFMLFFPEKLDPSAVDQSQHHPETVAD